MGLLEWIIGAAIAAVAGAVVTAAVITLIELTLREVLDWFSQRKTTIANDQNLVAVSALIQDAVNSGNVRVVQGVFNKSQQKMVESRTIDAERLDSELAARHRDAQYVEYSLYEY